MPAMKLPQEIAADWFPLAQRHGDPARPFPCGVCEVPPPPLPPFSERHLQCVWADARLRPPHIRTINGQPLEVEHPGEWNTGPGPDFLNAILYVGPDRQRVTGDVEIHIRPADWKRHRHASDPRYAQVCAHVTYYDGSLPPDQLPPAALQIALRPALEAIPDFSFDNIDLMAYPIAARATPPPCRQAMLAHPPARRGAILDAAGQARLRRRAELLQSAMLDRGAAQVCYEEVMAALGYRPNKAPFRRLARLLPLEVLRDKSRGDPVRAYALLMGCASLLPDPTTARRSWPASTKAFIRRCWDAWWPLADDFLTQRVSRADWTMSGIRPANRPERRLMAAALLFAATPGLPEQLEDLARQPRGLPARRLLELFELPKVPYWGRRLSFETTPGAKPVALIGPARARAILVNLLLPALAALGAKADAWQDLLDTLPAEESNELIQQTALRLLGPDHTPRLYATGLRRQGLIHIHHEYCLGDRSLCASCPYPDYLASLSP
jgi:hypothetical protein